MIFKSIALFLMISLISGNLMADEVTWKNSLARASLSVVSIKIDSPRAFDTEWSSSSQATGFVVDAENGLILTNRHVVTSGPVRAEALFLNNEEIELIPIYRDPVHDFGFFKYNPDDLKYILPLPFTSLLKLPTKTSPFPHVYLPFPVKSRFTKSPS